MYFVRQEALSLLITQPHLPNDARGSRSSSCSWCSPLTSFPQLAAHNLGPKERVVCTRIWLASRPWARKPNHAYLVRRICCAPTRVTTRNISRSAIRSKQMSVIESPVLAVPKPPEAYTIFWKTTVNFALSRSSLTGSRNRLQLTSVQGVVSVDFKGSNVFCRKLGLRS